MSDDESVLVEVFAHQGQLKGGRRHKIAADALKLITLALPADCLSDLGVWDDCIPMDMADAFDRLEAFCAVQIAEQGGYTQEAVARLQEAVGIGDTERNLISECLPALCDAPGEAVLLGVMLGLFASQA